ncbi:MAG TPA: DUF6522 family protein [Roseovarius sp.]
MTKIEFANDMIQVDAGLLAKAFRISAEDLKHRMRDGTITSRFERGEGEDAGKVRLTFFSADRRVRMTADENGNVLTCTAADFARPPLGIGGAASDAESGARDGSSAQTAGEAERDRRSRIDALLDVALQGTFPASDPIAVSFETPHLGVSPGPKPDRE